MKKKFDFSDITGEEKKVKKKRFKKKLTGIVLGDTGKDLAECSTEEFMEWTGSVFPFYEAAEQECSSLAAKVQLFNQIVAYNKQWTNLNSQGHKH